MTIEELAYEYEQQYRLFSSRVDALAPLLFVLQGERLTSVRRKIKIYYELACHYKEIASMLNGTYLEEFIDD